MPDLIIKPTATSGNKLILKDQAGGAVLTTADSGATIANATLTTPTIANMANCTFPAGHVLQVKDATLSNVETPETARTSETVVAVANSQITITSGNKVHIYCQATLKGAGSSNLNLHLRLREGTDTSGEIISEATLMDNNNSSTWHVPFTLSAFDASPASTTPNYCMTMIKGSGGTSNVQLYSDSSDFLKIILMEVQG